MRFILQLSHHNIRQWKWRLVSIALIVTLTFALQVLYTFFVEISKIDVLHGVAELSLPYDLLVVVEPRDRILSREELPPLPTIINNQDYIEMVGLMEPVLHTSVTSAYGSFSIFGVPANSVFFDVQRVEYQGRWLAASGEIILPQEAMDKNDLNLGSFINLTAKDRFGQWNVRQIRLEVVGSYAAGDLPKALMLYDDAIILTGLEQPNACIFNYVRSSSRDSRREVTLASFCNWLRPAYPGAEFFSAQTPEVLSAKLLGTIYQPGMALLLLIIVFAFVGVSTIVIITFLERRHEFASYKTQGISRQQLITMFSLEYGVAEAAGLALGGGILLAAGGRIVRIAAIEDETIVWLVLSAGLISLSTVILAVLYPVATTLVASVNQLLLARRIPFRRLSTDHLERPEGDQVYRERSENLRLLKLVALDEAENDIILLKQVGDRVKKGETVALQERIFGYIVFEWRAFCNGEVMLLDSGGLIGIRPDDENEPFYPYPSYLLANEERRRKRAIRGNE